MRDISIVVYPGCSIMTFAAMTAFEVANSDLGGEAYDVRIVSETGGLVRTAAGFDVSAESLDGRDRDTLVVAGAGKIIPASATLVAFLKTSPRRCRRISSTCTGAFFLAQAGLLDGRRATTHWAFARTLERDFPAVKVEEDHIFVKDGPIWTSAGMTAGIDLALSMVEEDHGLATARATARKLVVYHRRSGGQSQHSALLDLDVKSDRIQAVLSFAKFNLSGNLGVAQLAEVAHLSPRQFSREFVAATGRSPAKAIESLRVEAARTMMEDGRHAIEVVARHTGFGDSDRMRQAFIRAFGQSPQAFRRRVTSHPFNKE